ncbi:hypothetical protein AVEN_99065-1 [Araneus ventricosus]|uniref:ATPase AAA-type core domain-containing protein n=1 Tax=Araneus ventricosus TaxID=182803 RepID=A0A4Y2FP87_ARAVE|nr:hypothetical protein AVEN_99065-1 [Araneus ventricosus]
MEFQGLLDSFHVVEGVETKGSAGLKLDEPTMGLDPVSKRHLWKKLHREIPATSDRTLILTTHSSNGAEVNLSRNGLFKGR